MNFIDRFVSFVDPVAGKARMEARLSIQAAHVSHSAILAGGENSRSAQMKNILDNGYSGVERAYNIGQFDPHIDPQSYINGNPNTDALAAIKQARRLLNDRAMNDPLMIHALETDCDSMLGEGIIPSPDSSHEDPILKNEIDELVDICWSDHFETTNIDVHGQTDIFGLQWKAEYIKGVEGEVLWQKFWNSKSDVERKGIKHPYQLEVLSCKYLADEVQFYEIRGVKYPVVGGIVLNPKNKSRVGYMLYKNDPDSSYSNEIFFVAAKYIIHDANCKQAGQIRGWSKFAPVVPKFHDLNDIDDSAAKRAKVDAAMGVMVEMPPFFSPGGGGTVNDGNEDDNFSYGSDSFSPQLPRDGTGLPVSGGGVPINYVQSGMVSRIHNGSKVHVIQPQPSGVYEPVVRSGMRRVAMAAGQTYESISKDYSQTNFISGRLAKGPVNRAMRRRQWQWKICIGDQIWRDFIVGCYNMNAWGFDGYPSFEDIKPGDVRWSFPIPDSADPEGEARAERMLVQMGKLPHMDMIARSGSDPRQVYRDIKRSYVMALDSGLDLDHFIFSGNGGTTESTGGLVEAVSQEIMKGK